MTEIYAHMQKGENTDSFDEFMKSEGKSPTTEAMSNAIYTGYEITFTGEWFEDGKFYATHVNGVELAEETPI